MNKSGCLDINEIGEYDIAREKDIKFHNYLKNNSAGRLKPDVMPATDKTYIFCGGFPCKDIGCKKTDKKKCPKYYEDRRLKIDKVKSALKDKIK